MRQGTIGLLVTTLALSAAAPAEAHYLPVEQAERAARMGQPFSAEPFNRTLRVGPHRVVFYGPGQIENSFVRVRVMFKGRTRRLAVRASLIHWEPPAGIAP